MSLPEVRCEVFGIVQANGTAETLHEVLTVEVSWANGVEQRLLADRWRG